MKKTTLLFLASLAVLTTGASAAANNQNESDVVVLPTYVVTITRLQAAEQRIDASLQEFTQQAAVPMVIAPELTLRKAQAAPNSLVESARAPQAVRLAKS
ncbi:MAG: hypothetical protein PSW75_10105 [bacterium]|nr:hypothetical protein [bacterium]MDI1334809.1 hypothetical protein [Lacunisphaera sp.]